MSIYTRSCFLCCFIQAVKVYWSLQNKIHNLTFAGLCICYNAHYLHTLMKDQRKHLLPIVKPCIKITSKFVPPDIRHIADSTAYSISSMFNTLREEANLNIVSVSVPKPPFCSCSRSRLRPPLNSITSLSRS